MDTKVVLLTGGSSGIGLELAQQLMKKGMRVYSAARRLTLPVKDEISSGEIIPVKMDVNKEEDIHSVLSRILQIEDRLDALICNAGNGIAGSVEDTSSDEAFYQMETNFFGAIKSIRVCLPIFRKQGFGKIMVNSSLAAIVPIPFQAFYTASKSALFTLMQALSMEVEPFGIQCCTVLTGNAKTNFTVARKFAEVALSDSSAYSEAMTKSTSNMEKDEKNGMEPSFIAREMVKQLTRKKMKEIIIPGTMYKVIYWLFCWAPIRLKYWMVKTAY